MQLDRAVLLVRLAQERTDQALQQLVQARQRQQSVEDQLEQLCYFLQDYTRQAEAAQSVTQLRICRDFLAKLNEALSIQQRVAKAEAQQVEQAEGAWQLARQQLESFKLLVKRAEQALERQRQRKEQQDSDEFVNNAQIRAKR